MFWALHTWRFGVLDRPVLHRVEMSPASLGDIVITSKFSIALGAAERLAFGVFNMDVNLAGFEIQVHGSNRPRSLEAKDC